MRPVSNVILMYIFSSNAAEAGVVKVTFKGIFYPPDILSHYLKVPLKSTFSKSTAAMLI